MEHLKYQDYGYDILEYISQIEFNNIQDVIAFAETYNLTHSFNEKKDMVFLHDGNLTRPYRIIYTAHGTIYLLSKWDRQAK